MRAYSLMLFSVLVSVISLSCRVDLGPAHTAPVASLSIKPTDATIQVGSSIWLSAIARDSSGDTLVGRAATWSTSASHIASVGPTGIVSGVTPGSAQVVATVLGKSDQTTITVTSSPLPPTLAVVLLTPASIALQDGATQQFAASGLMSDGSATAVNVTYSATGGTVTSGGLYTAGSVAGSYRVIATETGGTLADTSAVTITLPSPTLVAVVLTPPSVTLQSGATQQFAASGRMSDGSTTTVNVTYSATGGTITTGGFYTAGSVAGSYHVISTQTGGTLADTATVTLTAVPGQPPLWTADMETGNLLQWEDNIYQATPCGGQFNSGEVAVTVPSMDYARSGLWSAKMTIGGEDTAVTPNGTRMHRWCEPQRNRELYYSAWYYIPQHLTVTGSGWLNLFQFKSKPTEGGSVDPFFFLVLRNAPGTGAMHFMLTWWGGLTIEGPSPGQSGYRTWTSPQSIPVGRWFEVQARYVCAGDFTGAIQVWQDGVEIFKLDGVRTRYLNGDCIWGVNNYGTGISPSPVIIYIDDAVISQGKIGT